MHIRKVYILSLVLVQLLKWTPAFTQDSIPSEQIRMRQLTVDDGLSQGFIYDGLQDKEGFLWFTTMDGLNRFDGYNFTIYRHTEDNPYSLPENTISCIAEDDKGNLWIGTSNQGLYVMNRKTERFYPVPIVSPFVASQDYNVRKLVCRQNLLFIKTVKGMIVANIAAVQQKDHTTLGKIKTVTSIPMISEDEGQNRIMEDLSILNCGYNSLEFFTPDDQHTNWTRKIFTAKDFGFASMDFNTKFVFLPSINSLFILHEKTAFLYDLQKHKIAWQQDYKRTVVNNITVIDRKIYFISTEKDFNNILFEFDPQTYSLRSWECPSDIRMLQVLFKDLTGCLWVRTDTHGAVILNKQLLAFHIAADSGRFVEGPRDIYTHNEGNIYKYSTSTASYKKIIAAKDFNPEHKNNYLFEFLDHTGILWRPDVINKEKSLLIAYDTTSRKLAAYDWGFIRILDLFEDNQHNMWVVHVSVDEFRDIYLTRIDLEHKEKGQTYKFPLPAINEDSRFLWGSWQDEKNIIWLATDVGLFYFDPSQADKNKIWKYWTNKHNDNSSLSSDKLISLCPDPREPQKYLWIGTRGAGFNRFEKATGKCIRFSDKDGLPNNVAYDILPDESGNLWISTNMGLSYFTPPTQTAVKGTFRNFTEDDGIAGNEFNGHCGKRTTAGELFFREVKGVTWFRPAEVMQQQGAVPINFISLSVNNKTLQWEKDSSVIEGNIAYCKEVTLTHDQDIFSLSFSSMDFRNQKGKKYSWWLEGFDHDWTESSPQHIVTYTNLDPGTYTFRVRGTNTDGVLNEKGSSIKIIVLPAWYQTWWFRSLLVILVVSALYGLYRFRVKQILKMAALRNRIATDLHDEIGSTLSSISLYGESAKKMMPDNEAAGKVLSKINNSTAEMMEAMSDIVWAVNTKNDRFDNLANRMRNFAVQATETKNISLHFTENENIPDLQLNMDQRKNIYLIFKEAVNNAVKYSGCKNLWITIAKQHHLLVLTIRDDGSGFNANEKITGEQTHSFGGNGISNMKNRAADMRATLEVNSIIDVGTSIVLKADLKKS